MCIYVGVCVCVCVIHVTAFLIIRVNKTGGLFGNQCGGMPVTHIGPAPKTKTDVSYRLHTFNMC